MSEPIPNPSGPWPNYTAEEIEAVSAVLASGKVNYWTGTVGRAFEEEFARFAGTSHAIAVANGTLALDLAYHGLGIGACNGGSADDEVIVTSRSFMASASSIVLAGARPVFADVDRDTQNITPDTVAPLIGERTRAILLVHLAGWPCDVDAFRQTVDGRPIALVEDCAQAHGARHRGRSVGGLGDVAAWSFCQDKIMTTGGEGGMVTCNDEALWRRMWAFKDHGKSYEAVYEREHPPGFRWLHEGFGTNWRLTEMQSALGRIQLARMEEWRAARARNTARLNAMLAPYAGQGGFLRIPAPSCAACPGSRGCTRQENGCRHAHYKHYVFVRPDRLADGITRDDVIARLQASGVKAMQGSCSEMYLERAFDGHPSRPARPLPVARELGETSILFEVHPGCDYPPFDLSDLGR